VKTANLLPIYLRREPTTDVRTSASYKGRRPFDVVAYRAEVQYDPDYADNGRTWFGPSTEACGRWPWFYSDKPRHGCKTIMFNCWKWRAVWLSDVVEEVKS